MLYSLTKRKEKKETRYGDETPLLSIENVIAGDAGGEGKEEIS